MDKRIKKTINKIRTTKNLRHSGHGCFCSYYNINNSIGLKLLSSAIFKTKSDAKKSKLWHDAVQEMDLLNKVYEMTEQVPKAYKVAAIWDSFHKHYKIGIFMQHIRGSTLGSHIKNKPNYYALTRSITAKAKDYLAEMNINHDDMHDCNIIIKYGKDYNDIRSMRFIDFTPCHISITETKTTHEDVDIDNAPNS